MRRIVVDTNVAISALLFRGETSQLRTFWQESRVGLILSSGILLEYARVLAYPRFGLDETIVAAVLNTQVLPFAETVKVAAGKPYCRDPDDDKFIWCAEASAADALVTGDADLLTLRNGLKHLTIHTTAEELALLGK